LSVEHLFSKYGHYEGELSLRGPLEEINGPQPRAKQRRQLDLSAPPTGAAAPRGPPRRQGWKEQSEGRTLGMRRRLQRR